jgi:ribosomal protein S18 acetylase RimI-like enzyme
MAAPLRRAAVATDPRARPPTPADQAALAGLMLGAYRGSIDDEGETLDDALAVVGQLFGGEFGTPMWACSELVEHAGTVVAATLITLYAGGPFVAFSMTAPAWQRQGLARAGLQRAMARLAAGDEPLLRLVVTEGNPAERLYESLGFQRCPDPRGR